MTPPSPKATLRRYLQSARDAIVWKLDGLSEYDVRRPMTSTGTNLLGLIKHLASVELGYFGDTFGRRPENPPPWYLDLDAEPNVDMYATAEESRADILDFYRGAWAHAEVTLDALELESVGRVPWWPEERADVTLHQILVHLIAETNRHAGHADIVRELIDGAVGLRVDNDNMADGDAQWWAEYRERLESIARAASTRAT